MVLSLIALNVFLGGISRFSVRGDFVFTVPSRDDSKRATMILVQLPL